MIKAVIFDMDGLLIDSEPFWREAEIYSFGKIGIPLTEAMCEQTMGLKIEEVIAHWLGLYQKQNEDVTKLQNEIVKGVQQLILEKGKPMEGVGYILDHFKRNNYKIGLASSSFLDTIEIVLAKLSIKNYFEVIHSAEFEPYGKPHPSVFLSAAKKLDVAPTECVVFEDSFNGLIAAKAARMKTVGIPDRLVRDEPKYIIADVKLNSLLEFNEGHLTQLNNQGL